MADAPIKPAAPNTPAAAAPAAAAPVLPAAPRKLAENDVNLDLLKRKLEGGFIEIAQPFGQVVIKTLREKLLFALTTLRDDPELAFNMLTDITAVDNMRREDFEPARRFTVIHIVYSMPHGKRVRLETDVPEQDPGIPSASSVYKGAAWLEREAYDMFGVLFTGHPDPRRVLTPEYFEYHPLRKDYPIEGKGERDNFVRSEELE